MTLQQLEPLEKSLKQAIKKHSEDYGHEAVVAKRLRCAPLRLALILLEKRLGFQSFVKILRSRQLRWAGHVVRMDEKRFPRKFISSWVEAPRRRGRPQMNVGHVLQRNLKDLGIPLGSWNERALNRSEWRKLNVVWFCIEFCKIAFMPQSPSEGRVFQ